jgi:hypothetical protein
VGEIPAGHRRLQDRAEIDGGAADATVVSVVAARAARVAEESSDAAAVVVETRRFVGETDGYRSRCVEGLLICLRTRLRAETRRHLTLCHVLSPESDATQSNPCAPLVARFGRMRHVE